MENAWKSPTDNFRINFFIVLMDKAIVSFEERFDQMQQFQHTLDSSLS